MTHTGNSTSYTVGTSSYGGYLMQLLSLQGSNHGYCLGSPLVNKGMMMGGIYTGHGRHSHHGFHTADVVVTATKSTHWITP